MEPTDEQLENTIRSIPKEIRPPRDLWPGIQHALDNLENREHSVKQDNPFVRILAAAAVLLIVAGLWLFIRPTGNGNETDAAAMSRLFEQQKQIMLTDYRQIPALTGNWTQQLEELESAARAIQDALKNDPDNGVLLGMLRQVYMQQLDLIRTVHQPDYQSI